MNSPRHTPLCDKLGIEYPVVAFTHCKDVAVAVINAGGFAVLKDVAKTLVYELSRWRNTVSEVIPERIITRAPSAELRPDQKDQDSLPEYEVLDAIMQRYVEQNRSADEIIAEGFPEADVRKVVRLLKINEYKRRQAPVGPRITQRAFGRDWRYPITNRFS